MESCFKILDFLISENIPYQENIDLKTKTWIKRGGIARIWVQPSKMFDFETLVSWCQINKIRMEVIGNTSNCYFLNDYHPTLVISTLKLNHMEHTDSGTITCECGFNMTRLSKYCIDKGITGYEGFIGLPGTVAGAAINNSGCYGSLTEKVVKEVTILKAGNKLIFGRSELNYSHRNSILKSKEIDGIVLKVVFDASNQSNPAYLKEKANDFQKIRQTTQEHTFPNLGTTFNTIQLKKAKIIHLLIGISSKILAIFFRNQLAKKKTLNKILYSILGAGKLKKYISEHSLGCFIWRDTEADKAFFDYLKFIKKVSNKSELEIELKQGR